MTPEYNHSIPGVLKDALDYLDFQINHKAVAIVGYGVVGGARSAEHLRQIVNYLGAAVVPSTVALASPASQLDQAGNYIGENTPYAQPAVLNLVLDDLIWWANTLAAGRRK